MLAPHPIDTNASALRSCELMGDLTCASTRLLLDLRELLSVKLQGHVQAFVSMDLDSPINVVDFWFKLD